MLMLLLERGLLAVFTCYKISPRLWECASVFRSLFFEKFRENSPTQRSDCQPKVTHGVRCRTGSVAIFLRRRTDKPRLLGIRPARKVCCYRLCVFIWCLVPGEARWKSVKFPYD